VPYLAFSLTRNKPIAQASTIEGLRVFIEPLDPVSYIICEGVSAFDWTPETIRRGELLFRMKKMMKGD
jgi:hypothetical protein